MLASVPLLLQCEGVLPLETMPDGSPAPKWGHYQNWWQTIMTKIAPEMRGMGWQNLKCAGAACWEGLPCWSGGAGWGLVGVEDLPAQCCRERCWVLTDAPSHFQSPGLLMNQPPCTLPPPES